MTKVLKRQKCRYKFTSFLSEIGWNSRHQDLFLSVMYYYIQLLHVYTYSIYSRFDITSALMKALLPHENS